MMGRSYRKVKNSGEIDCWLEELGFYRKNVAYDETCLFRAIAEQLYCSQMQHESVRRECVEYGRKYPEEFDGLFSSRKHWKKHISKLVVHMVICGEIEFQLISKTYKRDIILFDGINFEVKNVTENNYDDKFRICLVTKDHYDVIYSREYIATAGFCQSIAYGILYENVFGVENVPEVVGTMLYGKTSPLPIESGEEKKDADGVQPDDLDVLDFFMKFPKCDDELQSPTSPFGLPTSLAPFPYKVAKALDPDIYRNIAYDTWTEMRREMRLGEWYHGDDRLILGTCCELKLDNNSTVRCYIQEFLKGKEECVVYIPNWAERKTVKYVDLAPEPDAKPWPLPYRFVKHSHSPLPALTLPTERKNYRRNRDKRLYCENIQETEPEIKAFEGCPLQMHSPTVTRPERQEMMVAPSAPPTPSVVATPHIFSPADMNIPSPFVYSYPTPPPYSFEVCPSNDYPPSTSGAATPGEHQSPPMYYTGYVEPETCAQHNMTPTTPPLAPPMYSVYPMPGTPIIYSPPPDQTEIPTAPPPPSNQMSYYAPNLDVQYMPPSPFVFPPTPPTWYPPGVNSQGFVFPTTAPTYNSHNGY